MSTRYDVIAYSITGNKVVFHMHNGGNLDEAEIKLQAETRLKSLGIPAHLARVYKITIRP